MSGNLGCSQTYQVLLVEELFNLNPLTGQAAYGRALGALEGFTSLTWDRRLDDTSEAVLVVPTNVECCNSLLVDAHTWHHGLAIFRDGELVWDGPIVQIKANRTQMTITAHDVSALLAKRLLPRDLCFSSDSKVCTGGAAHVPPLAIEVLFPPVGQLGVKSPEFVAARLVSEAFLVDGHGASVLLHSEGSEQFEASYFQFGGPVFDLLQKLASDFVNWTVLGRQVIIFDSVLGRTSLLMCEDFVNDTFETTEDGLIALTQDAQIADGETQSGVPTPASDIGISQVFLSSQVADPYYGLLQGVQDGNRALAVGGTQPAKDVLTAAAKNVVDGSYPPPVILSAENLQLSPNAPVTMAELVPGVIVPVIADCLCRPVGQEFMLAKLTVTVDLDGERVEPSWITVGQSNPGTTEEF